MGLCFNTLKIIYYMNKITILYSLRTERNQIPAFHTAADHHYIDQGHAPCRVVALDCPGIFHKNSDEPNSDQQGSESPVGIHSPVDRPRTR